MENVVIFLRHQTDPKPKPHPHPHPSVEWDYPWIAVTWSFAATVAEWTLNKPSPSVLSGGAQSGQASIWYTHSLIIKLLRESLMDRNLPISSVSDLVVEHHQVSLKTSGLSLKWGIHRWSHSFMEELRCCPNYELHISALKGAVWDFQRHLVVRLWITPNRSYGGRQEMMSLSETAESSQRWQLKV